jgi:hypothetical protein
LADAKRISNGEHHVTDFKLFAIGQSDGGKAGRFHLEHGGIGRGISADDLGGVFLPAGKNGADFISPFNDVIAGQDIAVL